MIRSPAGFDGGDRIKRYLDYYQPSYGVMMLSAGQAFSPASLFAAGEQGVWYDPSDFSTMFQDSAGITPVTAVEQPVGRILDKSGRGNHATQSTSASRPVLSARVNLLTYSEQFDNAVWTKGGVITPNVALAPDGTNTADRFVSSTTTWFIDQSVTTAIGVSYVISCYVKSNTGSPQSFRLYGGGITSSDLTATTDWQQISFTFTATGSPGNGLARQTAGGNNDLLIWGADLRPTNQTTLLPAYQRIAAATDYNTTGFPYYLRFDGSDDSMATGTITPGIDKAQVFAGVRKGSTAAFQILAEISTNGETVDGSFTVFSTDSVGNYITNLRGTAGTGFSFAPAIPSTNVISAAYDIGQASRATEILPRLNGAIPALTATGAASAGTANFTANPLYIGSRGGSSLRFNGNLYSLIVRFGSTLDATTISNTETYVNGKTLAY